MLPLELAGSTNAGTNWVKQEHKYKRHPSVYICTTLAFSREQIHSPLHNDITAFHTTPSVHHYSLAIQHDKFIPVSLITWTAATFPPPSPTPPRNTNLTGFILTEQKYTIKSSCLLLLYTSYIILI